MISMGQLRGHSLERAELYGKPHVGARYTGKGARDYERTQGWCCICGRPAMSCHHVVPRGRGERFNLVTPNGTWSLRSPLFALCGSGTTGCHDGFHGGCRFTPRWVWDNIQFEQQWWDGLLLGLCPPHHPALYDYGRWEIEDRQTCRTITIREGM